MNRIYQNRRYLLVFTLFFLGLFPATKVIAATVAVSSINCATGTDYSDSSGALLTKTCDFDAVTGTAFAGSVINAPSVLRAISELTFDGLTSSGSFQAQANAGYTGFLNNWDIVGLNPGDEALLKIDLQISGTVATSANGTGHSSSLGELELRVSGYGGSTFVNMASNTNAPDFETLQASRTISIVDGQSLYFNLFLHTRASTNGAAGTGMASADFDNTAGITGLQIFALDGVTPLAFSYETVDFTLYNPTVVPVPAAVWLFGSGLLGLIGIAKKA